MAFPIHFWKAHFERTANMIVDVKGKRTPRCIEISFLSVPKIQWNKVQCDKRRKYYFTQLNENLWSFSLLEKVNVSIWVENMNDELGWYLFFGQRSSRKLPENCIFILINFQIQWEILEANGYRLLFIELSLNFG